MTEFKIDKPIVLASFSKMFAHKIRPINPKKVKPISADDYLRHVKKNGSKLFLQKYEKLHEALQKLSKDAWILALKDVRLVETDERRDAFVIVSGGELTDLLGTTVWGIFDLNISANEDPEPRRRSCFCANENNCNCVTTTGRETCLNDIDCGGTGTSPPSWRDNPAQILTTQW